MVYVLLAPQFTEEAPAVVTVRFAPDEAVMVRMN